MNLVNGDDGFFEIISTGLLGTFHTDDLAVFLTQGTKGSNYFLCHNSNLFDLLVEGHFFQNRVILH